VSVAQAADLPAANAVSVPSANTVSLSATDSSPMQSTVDPHVQAAVEAFVQAAVEAFVQAVGLLVEEERSPRMGKGIRLSLQVRGCVFQSAHGKVLQDRLGAG
jgi:hypothetical protein